MGSPDRVHYMDNLRAFAMLLGIFFHAALAYSPMLHQVIPVADPQNSIWVDVLAFFSHTFRMPLFFIIAGFFAAMLINKKGLTHMFKNRMLRVGLPFVVFLPLLYVSLGLMFGWAIEDVEHKSPMLEMIAAMAQMPDAPPPEPSTVHLWFLYYLVFFYVLNLLLVKFVKVDWAKRVFNRPKLFLLLSPLLLAMTLASQHAPFPAPEKFIPQLWATVFFGLLYCFGYGLYKCEAFLDKLKPYLPIMFTLSVLAYGLLYIQVDTPATMQQMMENGAQPPAFTLKQFGLGLLQAIPALYLSLFLLVVGKTWCNQQSSVLRQISNSSYWIYIIHFPLLWMIQFWLLDVDLPLIAEFLISSLGTIAIGYTSYLLLVKNTPIGWLLNGRKKPTYIDINEPKFIK
ncbi:acyltransferase family protein [Paraglaciecola aquimarina]|uniref:Acyltransferase family protein n=1 Tax=Paraglaciecola algarum TaxID=3050085 RepID=A0ABS9D4L3_9ALTE|nr:acyltransferase family protein [Paraglaciecola sp. G1-23]MCF2947855.1 acyltransferase family protein [Paraglaciecola sp. G1-23]